MFEPNKRLEPSRLSPAVRTTRSTSEPSRWSWRQSQNHDGEVNVGLGLFDVGRDFFLLSHHSPRRSVLLLAVILWIRSSTCLVAGGGVGHDLWPDAIIGLDQSGQNDRRHDGCGRLGGGDLDASQVLGSGFCRQTCNCCPGRSPSSSPRLDLGELPLLSTLSRSPSTSGGGGRSLGSDGGAQELPRAREP